MAFSLYDLQFSSFFYSYSLIMSSNDDSRSPSSQVPLYLWGVSKVRKKRFVANQHHVTSEAHFQKWCPDYTFAIPNGVHVKLATSSINDAHCMDSNDPDTKIFTFRPFYFSLGFTFPWSKFFRKELCATECAPSQCTSNVYRAIMCFANLSSFMHATPSCLKISTKEIMCGMLMCWRSADGGKARLAMVHLFPSLTVMVRYTTIDLLQFCLNSLMYD